ncbi:hypothetical protein HSBAA_44160 [Vreelandella sulfidaeris]|uniref:CN hydrolase domain-containing protein n=1 Tax=Vreelandella sulfidaeris TaxID=115553 RepID=A0A455UA98_9GAMM|nr:hypothetical protein HSBAA_44160 [Halomonas sulfidaeris]
MRVGAVQWQMREFSSVEAALQQIEYFVDALSDYQSDFAVFPELFNAPLMGLQDRAAQQDQMGAIRFWPVLPSALSLSSPAWRCRTISILWAAR